MKTSLRNLLTSVLVVLATQAVFTGLVPSSLQTAVGAEPQAPISKLELEDGDSIVFLGDSITHQCLYTQYVEDFFYTRYPKIRLKLHNSGVGGAKAWDALQRFDDDVAKYKPKYVTVLLGMNDGRYVGYNDEYFQTYRQDMTQLIGKLKAIKAKPIVMTPTMFDSRAARAGKRQRAPETLELYNSVLAYYGTWLREVSVENGFGFVDMYSPLNNLTLAARKKDPNFTLIRDAVHPDPPGQVVMAFAIIDDMGLKGAISNIRLLPSAKGELAAKASGGKLTELKATKARIEFTWTADCLPWVVTEEAQLGATLTKLGHKASREALEIQGLAEGFYQLSIDGKEVGRFHSSALSRHVELQSNTKTPQYQQALAVANLNKERNLSVRLMRNEWRAFQGYARAAKSLKDTPDDAQLAKQVEGLKKRLEGLSDRVAEHEKAALLIEDQIFKTNQPKPRKYILQRTTSPAKAAAVTIQGTVTLNGEPLTNATINFIGEDGATQAVTDAAGNYKLQGKSLKPGDYSVTIGKEKSGIPKGKYDDAEKTSLRVKLKNGDNEIRFNIGD
jgi:lysophospholipase L1-like esterase